MKKEYTYTHTIAIDFDDIIQREELDKTASFEVCKVVIGEYIAGFDDIDYYVIDNEDEIAQDLYDYIQSKKD